MARHSSTLRFATTDARAHSLRHRHRSRNGLFCFCYCSLYDCFVPFLLSFELWSSHFLPLLPPFHMSLGRVSLFVMRPMREMLFVSPTVDSTVQLTLSPPPMLDSHPLRAFLLFVCASISAAAMLTINRPARKEAEEAIQRLQE